PAELAVRRQQVAFGARAAVRADEGRAELGDRLGGQAGEFGERVFAHGSARGRHGLPVPAVAARHHPGGRIPGHGGPAILAWEYRRPAHHGELPVAATIVLMNDSSQGVFLDLQNISLTGCRRSSPISQPVEHSATPAPYVTWATCRAVSWSAGPASFRCPGDRSPASVFLGNGEWWRELSGRGQNGRVTSAWPTMPEMLALRETDPRQVSGYRLLGRLGEGGQGVVYLAEGPTGGPAAVKLLPPTTDPQVRSRFLKEVAAAQRVARFCTAQVLDAGIFERRPFIVSEYVSGPSLVEVVEEFGPRTGAALERIAVATLTALGAVHAAGMVHRDFKPGNVLLGPDGPVVIDFGLAAVPGMTTVFSGEVMLGTPAYMAPEQLAGDRVTAAADMWAWAVAMVFAGTGELPFPGDSLTARAYAILLAEPLRSLVYRCLNKNAAGRPSARDALADLVAAGARLMGPIPTMASALAGEEE